MKLKQLVAGVATGYVTKAVQFVASMALVPFLLRPEVLGVENYGRVFTLIAFMSFGTVLTAGIRLSFVRSISQAVGDDPHADRIAIKSFPTRKGFLSWTITRKYSKIPRSMQSFFAPLTLSTKPKCWGR